MQPFQPHHWFFTYRRIKYAVVVFLALALGIVGLALPGISHAATRSSQVVLHTAAADAGGIVDLAAMQKMCAVIEVHLNGEQHTITCHQTYRSKKRPDLSRVQCGTGVTNIQIWNYDYSGQLCFTGFGYLGVNIYQVNEVQNEGQAGGPAYMWMRYYNPNGVTCTIPPFQNKTFPGAYTGVEVTQLDFGSGSGPQC